ncbi:MAG: oligosaccharide flippase family protein [Acidimicrobiia bacterium]|nr:oligosaccharide flippase family protein [Acidimicrobiia bacterium]
MSRSRVARNTIWELGAGLIATAANLGTLLVLTNGLGEERYGLIGGTMALMFLLGPMSALGAGHLIVRAVNEQGSTLSEAWRRYVALAPAGGAIVFVIVAVLRDWVLPQSPTGLLIALGLAELLANPLSIVVSQSAQAIEELWISSVSQVVGRVLRLILSIVFVFGFEGTSPAVWGVLHLAAATVALGVGVELIRRHLGHLPSAGRPTRLDARDGAPFGISAGSLFIKNEADKYLLLRSDFESAAGNYTAGYRILTAAQVPVLALVNATYSRFFRRGDDGAASTRLAIRLTALAEGYALVAGAAMWLLAPTLPTIFGGFEESVSVVRWLAIVPALLVGQLFAGQSLTGTGRNNRRVRLAFAAAVLNIVMNLILIPRLELEGALISTIATEAILAVALWVALLSSEPSPGHPTTA